MTATGPVLTPSLRRAFDRLAADLGRVFGPRFLALVAYGGSMSAAFAAAIGAEDLDALSVLVESWHRDGLATPLVMTIDEFRRSLDAFPLEYQTILDHHVLIAGKDPFGGLKVNRADLRRACEIHARSHLIHLRQGWLQAAGHAAQQRELLVHSAAPLRALLANVAHLHGVTSADSEVLVNFAQETIGMPQHLVREVLALEAAPEGSHRLLPRFTEYLGAAQRLWEFVDSWPAS